MMEEYIELIQAVDTLNYELYNGSGDTEGMIFSVELFTLGWGVKFNTEVLLSSEHGIWVYDDNNQRPPVIEILRELFAQYVLRISSFKLQSKPNPEPDGE